MTIEIERGLAIRPALSRCINIGVEQFADEYWGKKPLLSTAETLDRAFGDLFSPESVDELVSERGLRTPFVRMANEGTVLDPSRYTAPGGFGAEVGDQLSSEKVLTEFASGATIVLQGLHRTWGPIIDFTRDLITDIGHPAQVNAYVTPASSRGFDPHYDVHDVFVLQISGEKHWVIHEPAHVDPLRGQPWSDYKAEVGEKAKGTPVIDQVLKPGDALYLPRGWIHSATALGDTSIHLTIGMAAFTRYEIVKAALDAAAKNPALRSSLPLGIDLADPDALSEIVRETIAELTGDIENASEAGIASTVSGRLTREFAKITRPEPVRPLATVDRITRLGSGDVVRWRKGLIASLQATEATADILLGSKTLSLPPQCASALQQLHEGEPVALDEFAGLDLEDSIVVARRLLREGVLVFA